MSINQFKKTVAKKYMILLEAEEVELTDSEREVIEKRMAVELDGISLENIHDNIYRITFE